MKTRFLNAIEISGFRVKGYLRNVLYYFNRYLIF